MGSWSSYSGKFDSRVAERVYNLTLDGGADEEASNEGGEWAGMVRFRRAAVIVAQDSIGFVTSSTVSLHEADERWAALSKAIEGEMEADEGYPGSSDGSEHTPSWLED